MSGRGKSVSRTGDVFRVRAKPFSPPRASASRSGRIVRCARPLSSASAAVLFLSVYARTARLCPSGIGKGPEAEAEYSEMVRIHLQNGLQTPSHPVMTPIPDEDDSGASPGWGNASHHRLGGQAWRHRTCRNTSGTCAARYWTDVTAEATSFERQGRNCHQSWLEKEPLNDVFRNCAEMLQNAAK